MRNPPYGWLLQSDRWRGGLPGSDHESDARHHAHHVAVNVAGGEQASTTALVRRAPGRDVLLESVVDGLGASYDLLIINIPANLSGRTVPTIPEETPSTSVDRGETIAGVL